MGRAPLPKHIAELDGLRAIAILLVLAMHSCGGFGRTIQSLTLHGWMGVDLFFVLSGFLITGILLDTREDPHYFRAFYIRRILRIWPLYYTILAIAYVAIPHWSVWLTLDPARRGYWPYHALFVQNFVIRELFFDPLIVTWSLAIEEQFYLVWPLLVRTVPVAALGRVLGGIIVASPIARWITFLATGLTAPVYMTTWCRLDGLAFGALVAWWVRQDGFSFAALRRWGLVACGVAALVAALPMEWPGARLVKGDVLVYSVVALGFAGLLALALEGGSRDAPLARVLRGRVLRYVGRISYGLYLWHPIVYSAVDHSRLVLLLPGGRRVIGSFVAQQAALFAVASASWFFFEAPILRLKSRWAPERQPPRSATTAY